MAEPHVLTALKSGSDSAAYAAARLIAKDWQDHGCHQLYALATRFEWSGHDMVEEIDQLISFASPRAGGAAQRTHEELVALREWALSVDGKISVFWSTHGHRFIDSDGEGSCLTCGGRWQLVHDDADNISHGRYRNSAGEEPTECTGNTSMVHGEGECSEHVEDSDCPNCQHDCNDLLCTG